LENPTDRHHTGKEAPEKRLTAFFAADFFVPRPSPAVIYSYCRTAMDSAIQSTEIVKRPRLPKDTSSASDQSDADLFRRFRKGERTAYATLVRRWEQRVYRIAYRITGGHAGAEDVRQVVFLHLLEKSGSVRRTEHIGSWLRRLAVNESINLTRGGTRLRRTDEWRLEVGEASSPGADASEERLRASEEATQLAESLRELDVGDRALLSLRFDEDLTFQEIATVVGRPVNTVKS